MFGKPKQLIMKKLIATIITICVIVVSSLAQTIEVTLTSTLHNGYEVSCFGGRDGAITSTVAGGTPPYYYEWSNGESAANVSNLAGGYYYLIVKDNYGNEGKGEITLEEPKAMEFGFSVNTFSNGYNVSCFFCADGTVNTSVSGGITPYTFAWSDGSTFQNRTGLQAKYYAVLITDANGCTKQRDGVTLTAPSRDDWQMTGNANTNPATQFMGTTDNKDFSIRTYN